MLRRLILVPVLAVAAFTAVAPPASAGRLCADPFGGNDDTPRPRPGGIVLPYQICLQVPIDLPPVE